MKSLRLYRQLRAYINPRLSLTAVAYLCNWLGLVLLLADPMFFSYLIDHVLMVRRLDRLTILLVVIFTSVIGSVILNTISSALFRYLTIRHTLDLRLVITRHLRRVPLSEIEKYGSGKFAALMGYDTYTMSYFLNGVLVGICKQLFTMLVAIGMMFYLDWRLGLLTLLAVPLLLLLPKLFTKPLTYYVGQVRSHNEQIGAHLFECMEGSKDIKALGLEKWEEQRNEEMYQNLVMHSVKESLFRMFSSQASSLPISLLIILMYWFGTHQVLQGAFSVGMLVAAVTYLNSALNPIGLINQYFGDLQQTEVAMQRVRDFLQVDIEWAARNELEAELTATTSIVDGPDLSVVPDELHATDDEALLHGRSLRVYQAETEILHGIDFSIRQGEVVAFVGRSGSGKTTLFKTLMGFIPTFAGDLQLHGRDLSSLSRSELRARLGIVFQEPFIFKGTLFENIKLGNQQATEEEVYEAARLANLQDVIDAMPNGMQTVLDYRGYQLSGGQRQRLAIARVILKRPDILILDEPTSALDRQTEHEVMVALKNLMQGKTTLLSTHRLDTIRQADRIYVLEKGQIVESGTHEELMRAEGVYSAMVRSGFAEQETAEQIPEQMVAGSTR